MPVIKEFRCVEHGDFEHTLPICPTCKRIAKRVFLTPPNIGKVKEQNVNRVLDDVLPSQNLANYTNVFGDPKPTFSNVYENSSGMRAGWGLEALQSLGVPREAPLTKFDINTGTREAVSLEAIAASLPKGVSADVGSKVGSSVQAAKGASVLRALTQVETRYNGQ